MIPADCHTLNPFWIKNLNFENVCINFQYNYYDKNIYQYRCSSLTKYTRGKITFEWEYEILKCHWIITLDGQFIHFWINEKTFKEAAMLIKEK